MSDSLTSGQDPRVVSPEAKAPKRGNLARMSPSERERLVLEHQGLVHALARRYAGRGEDLEDLLQVGMEGLLKAIDRFDASLGNALTTFATPTILGEIRRHFRDRTRTVHVPRGIQDAAAKVSKVNEQLTGELGRNPSIREIAEHCELTDDEVLDAIASANAYKPLSLSATSDDDEAPLDVGMNDEGFAGVEGRIGVAQSVRRLDERERTIIHLRFERELTQSQIAERLGISQMHVSRLIRRALLDLRADLGVG